jgi:sarcosine oxidase
MYDVVVAGLGGMGSAVLAHCARRGVRAMGIEQYGGVHEYGASSGRTRIIRQAYFEDSAYVPLVLRAYELWDELQQRTGRELMRKCGVLIAGPSDCDTVMRTASSAIDYDLEVEHYSTEELRRAYPSLRVRDGEVGLFEPAGGAVFPERATRAHLDVAQDAYAEIRFDTSFVGFEPGDLRVSVELSTGVKIRARSLVLCLGPWFAKELGEAGVPLEVQRNVQAWFTPKTQSYNVRDFPAFFVDRPDLPGPLYGLPDFGDGVKAAFHGVGPITAPNQLSRMIDRKNDIDPISRALDAWMPGAAAAYRDAKPCMYSLTPDRHFVVDLHPQYRNVVLCGGFSGHGFKFAPVIGEICANLAIDRATPHKIDFLSAKRFAKK